MRPSFEHITFSFGVFQKSIGFVNYQLTTKHLFTTSARKTGDLSRAMLSTSVSILNQFAMLYAIIMYVHKVECTMFTSF